MMHLSEEQFFILSFGTHSMPPAPFLFIHVKGESYFAFAQGTQGKA